LLQSEQRDRDRGCISREQDRKVLCCRRKFFQTNRNELRAGRETKSAAAIKPQIAVLLRIKTNDFAEEQRDTPSGRGIRHSELLSGSDAARHSGVRDRQTISTSSRQTSL
jgi:hypothetical protein